MSLTGFQRRRRELAKRMAEQEAKVSAEQKNAAESQNKAENDIDIDAMDRKQLMDKLKELGVSFSPNSKDETLREKLRDAIK